jgi:hypothetical protein
MNKERITVSKKKRGSSARLVLSLLRERDATEPTQNPRHLRTAPIMATAAAALRLARRRAAAPASPMLRSLLAGPHSKVGKGWFVSVRLLKPILKPSSRLVKLTPLPAPLLSRPPPPSCRPCPVCASLRSSRSRTCRGATRAR